MNDINIANESCSDDRKGMPCCQSWGGAEVGKFVGSG